MSKAVRGRKPPKDMVPGTVHATNNFGGVTILKYSGAREVLVEFKNTGFIYTTRSDNIRKGFARDPLAPTVRGLGYLGVGPYSTKEDKEAHQRWSAMFARCYSGEYPTYHNCSVAEVWFNFQVFAEWHDENYVEGYDLDKDIKFPGNKVYSPDNCMYVPRAANVKASNSTRVVETRLVCPAGKLHNMGNMTHFAKEHELTLSSLSSLKSGKLKSHKGWRLA